MTIEAPSPARVAAYFLKLGATGFGGPIALVGAMRQTLVEERRWVSESDFADAMALAQLAPGPLAAQVAIYIGYLRGAIGGATLVAVAFVAPSFLIVWILSALYVRFGGLAWMQAVFYGVGACVIAIIARSAMRLLRSTLGARLDLWVIAAIVGVITAWTGREPVALVLLAGVVTMARVIRPAPAVSAAVAPALIAEIFWFFTKAGAFVFGSGLAIVPFLYGGVVQEYGWLSEQQFLDAVAVAMITPGPVVITVAFIGYLTAAEAGMFTAAVAVFLPVYLFVVIPAPWFRRHRDNRMLQAFVAGVTAAAIGAIGGAVFVLARQALTDAATIAIAVTALAVLSRWKIHELWLIGGAAIAGVILRSAS